MSKENGILYFDSDGSDDSQRSHDQKVVLQSYREAIEKILESRDYRELTQRFISYPVLVQGYWVFVVLELDKDSLEKYYRLVKKRNRLNFYTIHTSLINSAVSVFLEECRNNLEKHDPGKNLLSGGRDAAELIREGGKRFMYAVTQAATSLPYDLYEACNAISSLRYEGKEGLGTMIIVTAP